MTTRFFPKAENHTVPLESIKIGDCFMYNNHVYMRSDEQEGQSVICMRIDDLDSSNGYIARLDKRLRVTPIDIDINEV